LIEFEEGAMRDSSRVFFLFSCVAALISSTLINGTLINSTALAQSANPPPGYFDIPAGFDFPAPKATLEGFITSGNVSAERLHVWNVFAGMTQAAPGGKFAIFETWYSEQETFDPGSVVAFVARAPRLPRFQVPRQFLPPKGAIAPQVAGQTVLSSVLYNFAAYNHVRSNGLYKVSTLDNLQQNGTPNPTFPKDRDIPAFPASAVSLKTVWWPIAKDRSTAMPIWDPDLNPTSPSGNPPNTWARYVAVDPTRTNVPPDEFADVVFQGQTKHVHVVGSDKIHLVEVTADQASGVNSDGLMSSVARAALGRDLQAGDFAALVATHMTTKEIDNWVWATFWWHDRPDQGPFAADRPGSVAGVWRNYLTSVSYDLNLPREADGSPHVAFNPWLEARFPNGGHGTGVVSNCMNCHNRASYPDIPFLPVYRGNPDPQDKAFEPGRLRTDFLWSVPDQAQ
jgi:hypothetical protein